MSDIELTDREEAIARRAAKLAIEEMSGEFYKKVGKTVVEKALILRIAEMVTGKDFVDLIRRKKDAVNE